MAGTACRPVVLGLFLGAAAALADPAPWDFGGVETSATATVVQTDIVLDASDTPHIAFNIDNPAADDALYYAVWHAASSQFVTSRIAHGEGVGAAPSLALTSGGSPRIAYDNAGLLYYAVKYPSGWIHQYVGAADPGAISLAVDPWDRPGIAYVGGENDNLNYAWNAGSGWTRETVAADLIQDVSDVSLAFAGLSQPRIALSGTSMLRYASLVLGEWAVEAVPGGSGGEYVSLALDSQGFPHISYYDPVTADLMYVHANGSGWNSPQTVDSAGDVGRYASLALDSNDKPHISYYDATSDALKYAYRINPWHIETIQAGVGSASCLALDGQGKARVSYAAAEPGDVGYGARRTAAGIIPEPISMAFMASVFAGVVGWGARARRRRRRAGSAKG